jgi:hypothetical protein
MKPTNTTTIRVSFKTKDKLIAIGRKNQSFDSIILSLLPEQSGDKKERQN